MIRRRREFRSPSFSGGQEKQREVSGDPDRISNHEKKSMKKIKFACNVSLLTLLAVGQWACAWDPYEHDADPVPETLTLTASSADIVLDEEHLTDPVLTFEWTPARQVSDDFLVTYTTKLDVVTNNFGSSTTIVTVEDEGIFSRSFTSEQLNNWANERWNLPVNKNFTLAFRVIAEYVGGETYEMPEVRTVEVNVTPIHVDIFGWETMISKTRSLWDVTLSPFFLKSSFTFSSFIRIPRLPYSLSSSTSSRSSAKIFIRLSSSSSSSTNS